jgi:thiamine transport system permease protein
MARQLGHNGGPVVAASVRSLGNQLQRRVGVAAVAALPLVFISVFFLYPVGSILWRGLVPDGSFDPSPLKRVLTQPELRRIAWFTLWQAAASTVVTLIVAMPGAYVLSHYKFRGRSLVRAAVTIPLILPTVVVGVAFLALAGPNGSLGVDLKGSIWIILLAHVFYNYAVVIRTVGGLWGHLDPRIEQAARVLGASRVQAFRQVTLPLLRPAIGAAASIVFLFSFTSFGVILILGGARRATLEVEIFRQTAQLLNLPVAASLAITQLICVFTVLTIYSRYQERRTVELNLRPSSEVERVPTTRREKSFLYANLAAMGLLLFVPLGILVKRSLSTGDGAGLDYYRALIDSGSSPILAVSPSEALQNSLTFALIAALLALIIGGLAASIVGYGRSRATQWFDSLLMLPLGTSAVTVGFGFLISLDRGVLDLRSKTIIIPLAHTLVALPFVIRVMVPIIRSIDPRLREAAATLGASPVRVWREIDLPIVAKAGLVGAGFAAAVSLGEFGATTFIVRPNVTTLPVAIFRLLSRPGAVNFGMAMAMSVVLMLVTGLIMLFVERFRAGDVGSF